MIKLELKRIANLPTYTIGRLFVNGEYFCDTLEDKDRDLYNTQSVQYINKTKVYGQTAIPKGTYTIITDVVSPKFKKRIWAKPYGGCVPRLQNVPGFEGILIHPGNSDKDTYGCILVGENKEVGKVLNSQNTYHHLMNILLNDDDISITIL